MPELPEVETTKAGIIPVALGQTVAKVIIRAPKLRWPIPTDLPKQITGKVVRAIERRAKYLLIKFDHGTMIMHLGMSGRLRNLATQTPAEKHDHVDICFKNGATLRYTDPRRFGAILWTKEEPFTHKLLVDLGPEPLTDLFDGKHLQMCAANKKLPVKVFIMDAKVVVGVGNIYASEALFAAKIDPRTPANLVTRAQYNILAKHIKKVLQAAILQGGTTLKDFFTTEGKPGYFTQQLQVYGRDKLPCFTCKTTIEALPLGQRNTFYCPSCQK